jgi:hypothetical protein
LDPVISISPDDRHEGGTFVMTSRNRVRAGILVVALSLQPALAHAVVVVDPGPIVNINGTTVALRPNLAGVVLEDVLRPFQAFGQTGELLVQGAVQDRVIQSNLTGKMIFDASIHIDYAAPGETWEVFGRWGFASFLTDVDWLLDGLGTLSPDQAWRNPGTIPQGDLVVFAPNQSVPIHTGDVTRFMTIETDAPFYAESQLSYTIAANFSGSVLGASMVGFVPIQETTAPACSDKVDDDHDGLVDYPDDPGCESPSDVSEDSPSLPCDDGADNDADFYADYRVDGMGDPGCFNVTYMTESPACQDGIDNDGDGGIDFDGGASANGGVPIGPADAQCTKPYRSSEKTGCGLGVELAAVVPIVAWIRRRRRLLV